MNGRKLLLTGTGVIFILTMLILSGSPGIIQAAERCDIVTIRGCDNIEPSLLSVKKGDCVVWINFTGSTAAGYTKQDVQ